MSDNLLDSDKTENHPKKGKFKSRVPSDLMIVLGVLHAILGLLAVSYYFYLVYEDFIILIESDSSDATSFLIRRILYNGLIFLFGLVLTIGGVGLIRHRISGWVFTLAGSSFGVLIPIYSILISLLIPGLRWSLPDVFVILFVFLFGLSFAFLISKTIRNFFQPTTKSYAKSGIILLILSLIFLALPFLTAL